MAGYELVRLDSEGRIPIPTGETVLGRGPLLGVSDKRVSRQHGVLENQNGRLRLKPVHLNPCFVLQGGALGGGPRPLERDCWHPLGPGETFSLMPGRFVYRVEALTPRAVGGLEGEGAGLQDVRDSPHIETAPQGTDQSQTPAQTGRTPPPADSPECEALPSHDAPPTQEALANRHPALKLPQYEEQSGRDFLPKPKRVLPAWMTAEGASRKQLVPAADKTKCGRAQRRRAGLSSEEGRAGLSSEEGRAGLSSEEGRAGLRTEEGRAGLRTEEGRAGLSSEEGRAGLSSEEGRAGLSSEEGRAGLSSEEGRAGLSSEEGSAGLSSEEDRGDEVSSGSAPRRKRRRKMSSGANTPTEEALPPRYHGNGPRGSEPGGLPDDGAAEGCGVAPNRRSTSPGGAGSGNAASGGPRPRCPYGGDCYRKNPLHFQDCCHPGDHDYKEEEESEEDVARPECPYGIDCYRKNPLHLKEYSHSRRRAPARRTAPPARADEDEDYEDSFIDDSSDEAYDDSDYVPAGSDGSGPEDPLEDQAKNSLRSRK